MPYDKALPKGILRMLSTISQTFTCCALFLVGAGVINAFSMSAGLPSSTHPGTASILRRYDNALVCGMHVARLSGSDGLYIERAHV